MLSQGAPSISSAEEIDSLIKEGSLLPRLLARYHPLEKTLVQASSTLTRLVQIKFLYGTHPATEVFFSSRRAEYAAQQGAGHLQTYHDAFGQINSDAGDPFGSDRVQRFLDLGCSPGGFSEWLLCNNTAAIGTGITLADEDASWHMDVTDTHLAEPRYTLHFANLVDLVSDIMLGAPSVATLPSGDTTTPTPTADEIFRSQPFDLIIGGAFPSLEGRILGAYRLQLQLSQLLLVLKYISVGGNAVLVTNTKVKLSLIEIVGLLRQCFTTIRACKGRTLHAKRSSCYLVCMGFHAEQGDRERFVKQIWEALQALQGTNWSRSADRQLERDSEEATGHSLEEEEQDLEESFTLCLSDQSIEDLFACEEHYFLKLFEPVWQMQSQCLHRNLCKNFFYKDDVYKHEKAATHNAIKRGEKRCPPVINISNGVRYTAAGLPTPVSPSGSTNPWSMPLARSRPSVERSSWRRSSDVNDSLSRTSSVLTSGLFASRRRSSTSFAAHSDGSWRTRK